MEDSPGSLTRRQFLTVAGAAGSAALLGIYGASQAVTLARRVGAQAPYQGQLRIAVLLPQSTRQPQLGQDLLDGMSLAAQQLQLPKLMLTAVDYGVSPARAIEQARALVESGTVDLLIAAACRNWLTSLAPSLEQHNVSLVVSDVGANTIDAASESSRILRASLGHWQASWALGAWAFENLGSSAVLAASLYESGYDSLYAFQYAFEQAGGRVLDTEITHRPAGNIDLAAVMQRIREAGPELVYAAYGQHEALEFIRAYHAAGLAHIPLVGPGFLVDEALLSELGRAALGIRTVSSWPAESQSAERQDFERAFSRATGRAASAFAAQGYETLLLLAQSVQAAGGAQDSALLRQAFVEQQVQGPRGLLSIAPATLEAGAPLYLHEVHETRGRLTNATVAEVGHASSLAARSGEIRPAIRTGWIHGYLYI